MTETYWECDLIGGAGIIDRFLSLYAHRREALLKVEGQLPGSHELLHHFLGDRLASGLVLSHQRLKDVYECLLELPSEHGSARVILPGMGCCEQWLSVPALPT